MNMHTLMTFKKRERKIPMSNSMKLWVLSKQQRFSKMSLNRKRTKLRNWALFVRIFFLISNSRNGITIVVISLTEHEYCESILKLLVLLLKIVGSPPS